MMMYTTVKSLDRKFQSMTKTVVDGVLFRVQKDFHCTDDADGAADMILQYWSSHLIIKKGGTCVVHFDCDQIGT